MQFYLLQLLQKQQLNGESNCYEIQKAKVLMDSGATSTSCRHYLYYYVKLEKVLFLYLKLYIINKFICDTPICLQIHMDLFKKRSCCLLAKEIGSYGMSLAIYTSCIHQRMSYLQVKNILVE